MARFAEGKPLIVLRVALALVLAASAAFLVFSARPAGLEGDQQCYATLGLNLVDHGVFSSAPYAPEATPAPSLAWAGPLVAGEIALAAWLDPATKDQLVCIAANKQGCDLRL